MEQLRTFIAIELTREIQDVLKTTQEALRKSGGDVKWVKPENIHLTLKFLGELTENKIDLVKAAMRKSLIGFKNFSFQLDVVGAFPKIENPKIIWVGISTGKLEIGQLVTTLGNNLESLGVEKEERDFAPHITIGRLRSSVNRFALTQMIKNHLLPPHLEQKAGQVILFKSTLTSQGPIYEAIEKFALIKD